MFFVLVFVPETTLIFERRKSRATAKLIMFQCAKRKGGRGGAAQKDCSQSAYSYVRGRTKRTGSV